MEDISGRQERIMNNIGDTNILLKLETMENNYRSLVQRLEVLEKSASKFSDEYINNIDSRLREFSGTNERLEKTIEMIGDNKGLFNNHDLSNNSIRAMTVFFLLI